MAEFIRLQKYFTDCGILSRRAAEAEIRAGTVLVNGTPASLGDKIDPTQDLVEWNGKRIVPSPQKQRIYLMLNKPKGYVTTSHDEKGRKTVLDLVKTVGTRVYPVGRLDMDSEGLLLLTNDGQFADLLTHPRHKIPKIYRVTLDPPPSESQRSALAKPMTLDGYRLQPIGVRKISETELELRLHEGRNRQIRRMCASVGLQVTKLRRIAIGKVQLKDLPNGAWRYLTAREVAYLQSAESKPSVPPVPNPDPLPKKKGTKHAGSTAHSR